MTVSYMSTGGLRQTCRRQQVLESVATDWLLVDFDLRALQQRIQNKIGGFDDALVTRAQIRVEVLTGEVL